MSAMTAPIGRRRTSAAICSDVGRRIPGQARGRGLRGEASAARAGGDRRWEAARGGAGSASSRAVSRMTLASSASARSRPRVMRARIRAMSLALNRGGLIRSVAASCLP